LARLLVAQLKLLRAPRDGFEAVIVGYPGHLDVPTARRVASGAPVILNPLVSLTDTLVEDRRRFRRGSLAARTLALIDRAAFRCADVVVADTPAHAELFRQLGARRVEVCFVGAEENVFHPPWEPVEPFRCLFVGKLIPLHGLETILEAAWLAPEVRFRVVGSGQLQHLLSHAPPNVDRVGWVEYKRLGDEYRAAGCALGIFARTGKAYRVIPNKAFQAIACGTPLITADTRTARELLDDDTAMLVPPGDARALAEAVRRLAGDSELAARLSSGGLARYREHASEGVLGARWRGLIEQLV
jgi:glycosyltransferase involved in cell wall biosynthesis